MQKHLANQNKSIADSFTLPETVTGYDPSVLLATIIRRYSTLPVLYNDPDWFYDECDLWWKENKYAFTQMWLTMEKEYNPIENYDRNEEGTITNNNSGNKGGNNSGTTTVDAENNITSTESNSGTSFYEDHKTGSDDNTKNLNTENTEAAFNSGSYQPVTNISETGTDNHTITDNSTHSETDSSNTTNNSRNDANSTTTNSGQFGENFSEEGEQHTSLRVHGNIGVTTTQQMMESEIDMRRKYNLYKIMANTFADDLCLGIW